VAAQDVLRAVSNQADKLLEIDEGNFADFLSGVRDRAVEALALVNANRVHEIRPELDKIVEMIDAWIEPSGKAA
jgi:hypothetical protein